jgi:formylglycine-generating enzyme required for sulfatase activity
MRIVGRSFAVAVGLVASLVAACGSPKSPSSSCDSTCGPTQSSSCCDSALVPGGTFYRYFDVATDNLYTDQMDPATVSDFRLDTYEVTVGRFRRFLSAGTGTQRSPPAPGAGARRLNGIDNQGGWDPAWNASLAVDTASLVAALKCNALSQTWTDAPGVNENLPIGCITWFEAMAFCIWDGGFLPTQTEWDYAAAGGTDQRAYPWSAPPSSLAIDCSYASYYNQGFCAGAGASRVGAHSPAGDGRWGHADLGGNVSEWTLDAFSILLSANPCVDCAYLTPASSRAIRGGAFLSGASNLRSANDNFGGEPASRQPYVGVRCARSP